MKPFSDDTDPAAHAVYVRLLRERTPAERLLMTQQLRRGAEAMALAALRRDHPEDDERTLRLRLAVRKYGRELVRAATGWEP